MDLNKAPHHHQSSPPIRSMDRTADPSPSPDGCSQPGGWAHYADLGDLIATKRALLGHQPSTGSAAFHSPPAAPRKLPYGECQADNARAANIHLFQSWWKYLKPYLNLRRGHSMDQHGTLWHFLPWQHRGHCPTRTWPTCEPTLANWIPWNEEPPPKKKNIKHPQSETHHLQSLDDAAKRFSHFSSLARMQRLKIPSLGIRTEIFDTTWMCLVYRNEVHESWRKSYSKSMDPSERTTAKP